MFPYAHPHYSYYPSPQQQQHFRPAPAPAGYSPYHPQQHSQYPRHDPAHAERLRRMARYLPHEIGAESVYEDDDEDLDYQRGRGFYSSPHAYHPGSPYASQAAAAAQQQRYLEEAMRRKREIEEMEEAERIQRERERERMRQEMEMAVDDGEVEGGYNGYPARASRSYSSSSSRGLHRSQPIRVESPPLYPSQPTRVPSSHAKVPVQTPSPPVMHRERSRSKSRSRVKHAPVSPVSASQSSSRSQSPPIPKAASSPPRYQPHPQSTSRPSPSPIKYTEHHHEAATKIQNAFRARLALKKIRALRDEFDRLRSDFMWPPVLDFVSPGGNGEIVTVPVIDSPDTSIFDDDDNVPQVKLAFSTNNFAVHSYMEGLNRLLLKLDAIESWGERRVREQRREVVREVEREAGRIERGWKGVWTRHVVGPSRPDPREKEDWVVVDEGPSKKSDDTPSSDTANDADISSEARMPGSLDLGGGTGETPSTTSEEDEEMEVLDAVSVKGDHCHL